MGYTYYCVRIRDIMADKERWLCACGEPVKFGRRLDADFAAAAVTRGDAYTIGYVAEFDTQYEELRAG